MPASDIYIFNPTCDFAVANNTTSWQPNRTLQQMERDLSNLPQFMCKKSDVVLVHDLPSEDLLNNLKEAGFDIPRFIKTAEAFKDDAFIAEPKGMLKPWGWSPAVHHLLQPLKRSCSKVFSESPVNFWKEEHRELFSRKTALEALKKLLEKYPDSSFMEKSLIPQICQSPHEVNVLHQKWGNLMVKLPWGSSGRGLQPITRFPLHKSIEQRLTGMLRNQKALMVEPLLHKQYDLGFLYEILPDRIVCNGLSRFFTDKKGQYQGNFLNGYHHFITEADNQFITEMEGLLPVMHTNVLSGMNIGSVYQGPLGIDTLIYREANGDLKINPVLEINWRFTMGHLSLKLEKRLSPQSKGIFSIWHNDGENFSDFVHHNMKSQPLRLNRDGLIVSGFLALTDYARENKFGAFIEVFSSRGFRSF